MHEAALARQILDIVLASRDAGSARVRSVRGWVAETEGLSAESLGLQFAAHAHGTPAEGATLDLRLEHVSALCRACGARFLPEHHLLLCPTCGSTDAQLQGRTGLGIDAIEVD